MKANVRENVSGYLFILPVILGILVFTLTPFLLSFYYSFTNFDNLNPPTWVGFANFTRMFGDAKFWNAVKVTAIYAVITVVLSLVLSFLLALVLNLRYRGMKVFRVLLYTPVIIPGIAAAAIWGDMFNSTYVGIVNRFLAVFGIDPFPFFTSSKTALFSMIILSLWGLGGNMLIWIAGFNGISPSLYEAAELDGAGRIRKLVSITLPMMTPVIFYNLVMGVITALQAFGPAYLLTGGGPLDSTNFLALNIYNTAIGKLEMGYASAQAWFLFVVIITLTIVVFLTSGWVYYGDGGEKK
jgi:ABC transporter, permease protein